MKKSKTIHDDIGVLVVLGKSVMDRAMKEGRWPTAVLIGKGLETLIEAAEREYPIHIVPKRPEDTP
jgi:hypothetical protein